MPQLDTKPLPERNEDESLIGDDGELLEPDQNVDLAKYALYVANFRLLPRQFLNEWDDARMVEWLGIGCLGVMIISLVISAVWIIQIAQGINPFPIPH